MRIPTLRTWLTTALDQGAGHTRRIASAMSKRIRQATGRVDAGVDVGGDESRFGGNRTRIWLEWADDARARFWTLLEQSVFERFARWENLMRRIFGRRRKKAPRPMTRRRRRMTGPLGAHDLHDDGEIEDFRRQVREQMVQTHTREAAGLRDRIAQRGKERPRRGSLDPSDPDEPSRTH